MGEKSVEGNTMNGGAKNICNVWKHNKILGYAQWRLWCWGPAKEWEVSRRWASVLSGFPNAKQCKLQLATTETETPRVRVYPCS